MVIDKKMRRERKKKAIRNKLRGTTARPRLTVFKSCKNIYAQIIDDDQHKTICAASTLDGTIRKNGNGLSNIENAVKVGKLLGKRAKEKKISVLVFDRNGYKYHGRLKALADACRESGLQF